MEDTTAAVATPAATTSTPSAPTSSPTSEPTSVSPMERPSFAEALAGKRPTPDPQQVAPPSTESPTTQADGTTETPTPSPATAQGPIPLQVHTKALENARLKAKAEIEQEYRTKYGDPERVTTATQWFDAAARDPDGFLDGIVLEALQDPARAQRVRSLAGRALGGHRPPAATAPTDQPPSPDFDDGQGNKFYSAAAQEKREQWLTAQITKQVMEQVQPDLEHVRAERAQREQQAEQSAAKAAMEQKLNPRIAKIKALPQFKEHQAEILAEVLKRPFTSGDPLEEAELLRDVYDEIVGPKLTQLEQAKFVASLKQNAHASTLNPAATGAPSGVPKTAQAKHGGSMAESLKWAAAQQTGR